MCRSQGILMAAQMDQLNFILGFQGQTAKPVFDVLILTNNKSCDLSKLCPGDTSSGTVWRISSVCQSDPARLDCKMRCNSSTSSVGACYTSSREALCTVQGGTNTTDRITTVFQDGFDVPHRALVSAALYAQAIKRCFNLERLLLAVVSILL